MKKFIRFGFAFCLFISLVACSASSDTEFDCEANTFAKNPVATIKVKDFGIMKYELYINRAPQSVANFVELANSGFYNGLTFHRLDQEYAIIQGGDPDGNGAGGPGYAIKGEFYENKHCNDLANEKGTIAMARSQEFDSAGSQFYLNFKDNSRIFGLGYAVFGRIIEGEDVLSKFEKVKTVAANGMNVPEKTIIIESISVETFDQEMPEINKIK